MPQFYVADGELSCQMYQRSCDLGLGVPFNIASYSLLTCMVAQVGGCRWVGAGGVAGLDGGGAGRKACWLLQQCRSSPAEPPRFSLTPPLPPQVCGLRPGDFVHVLGDAHVYANHVEPLKEQLRNAPRHFPRLRINPDRTDIDSFTMDDFELEGYQPHKAIKMQMAV